MDYDKTMNRIKGSIEAESSPFAQGQVIRVGGLALRWDGAGVLLGYHSTSLDPFARSTIRVDGADLEDVALILLEAIGLRAKR